MRNLLIACLVIFPVAANAASKPLTVKQLCDRMVNVQSSGDVEYNSSKDVHGRDVAPADLDDGTPQVGLSDNVTVSIGTNDLQQLNLPGSSYTPYMNFGDATIKKDGSVYFNGQRLSQPQVQSLCNDKPNMAGPDTNKATPPVGQTDEPLNPVRK